MVLKLTYVLATFKKKRAAKVIRQSQQGSRQGQGFACSALLAKSEQDQHWDGI